MFGASTWGACVGAWRTVLDMEADGCAAADDTPGPLTPAAVAATLVAGAAIFLSTGLLCAGAATGGFGSAGRLGATDTLAGFAAAGAEGMNFASGAALI